jgi:LysR family glycine cleavage system transcriptional activator
MVTQRLPSLNGIRSFAVAARLRSFTAAARELSVTQGAISRSVRALEIELGVALFNRVGRAVELTTAGEVYYEQIAEGLRRIAGATNSIRQSIQCKTLAVSFLPTFAMRWLCPRLSRFQRRHPDILVDVSSGDGAVDFPQSSIDLALRYGTAPWSSADATLFMNEEMGVFCAPALLGGAPTLKSKGDLLTHRLLVHTTRPHCWRQYFDCVGLASSESVSCCWFEHLFMVIEAAAAGMGIALLPLYLARDEVAAGRLTRALSETYRPVEAYYLLQAPGRGNIRNIRLFKNWLFQEIQSSRPDH